MPVTYPNQNSLEEAFDYYYNYSSLCAIISNKYNIPLSEIINFVFDDFRQNHPKLFDIVFEEPDTKNKLKLLKLHLKLRKLKQSGNKDELISRLKENMEELKKTYFIDFSW